MLRSAEEIRKRHKFYKESSVCSDGISKLLCKKIEEMINDARKECLKEAALQIIPDGNPMVAREKILNLIDQLK